MNKYWLSKGAHADPGTGRCAMEWVAFIAGEEHSDQPRCVDTNLAALAIVVNDNAGDEDRQRLRPYLARMIGTRDDERPYETLIDSWVDANVPQQDLSPCRCAECFGQGIDVDTAVRLFDAVLPKEFIDLPEPVASRAREVCPS